MFVENPGFDPGASTLRSWVLSLGLPGLEPGLLDSESKVMASWVTDVVSAWLGRDLNPRLRRDQGLNLAP